MYENSDQPTMGQAWTPFWSPIKNLGESGLVLYLQGRDYKAEDALALIDLIRFVPEGCRDRVQFLPMQAKLQLVIHIKELQQEILRMTREGVSLETWVSNQKSGPSYPLVQAVTSAMDESNQVLGRWDTFWEAICAFSAEFTERRKPTGTSQIQPAFADAENLLVIGRPEYYAAWWDKKHRLFRELLCRAGYPARYAFPDRGSRDDIAQPIGKALFDRKWLLQYGEIDTTERKEPEEVEHDYGLVLHSQVIYKGARRKVTLCVGCQALGTWAAARFVADPAHFRQLNESKSLNGQEFPLEILLRVKKPRSNENPLVGINNLTASNIRILHNDPREYLGQIYDPPCDWCDPPCGATRTTGQSLRHSNTDPKRQCSNIGRSLRDLRMILDSPNPPGLLDATRDEILGGLLEEKREDHYDAWTGTPCPPPIALKHSPQFSAKLADGAIEVTLTNGQLNLGESCRLAMGPRLFSVLWNTLSFLAKYKMSPNNAPHQPVLLLGGSGSGKDPLVRALRHGWDMLLSANVPESLRQPPDYPLPLSMAELASKNKEGIAEHLRSAVLNQFIDREGSVFIDEFSDISTNSQVALLRLLQDGVVSEPAGADSKNGAPFGKGDRALVHRALLIAATSQPLEQQVRDKEFRADLLFRFHVVKVPDLADRPLDALAILMSDMANQPPLFLTLAALKLFLADPFVGNVRLLIKETIPRIRDIRRPDSPFGPILRFAQMAEALSIPSAPSRTGQQLFDDPNHAVVRLQFDKTAYTLDNLMKAIPSASIVPRDSSR